MQGSSETHPLVKIINVSQDIERILEKRFGATGNGLGLKLTSVEDRIPAPVCKIIRRIATIRNKAAHKDVGVAEENAERVDEFARYVATAFSHSNDELIALGEAFDTLQGFVDFYSALLVQKYGADENQSLNAKINSVEKKLPKGVVGKLHKLASYHNKASFTNLAVAYDEREIIISLDQSVKKIFRNSEKNNTSGAKNRAKRLPYNNKKRSNQVVRQEKYPRRKSNLSYNRSSARRSSRPSYSSASNSGMLTYVALGIFILLVLFGVIWLCRAMAL